MSTENKSDKVNIQRPLGILPTRRGPNDRDPTLVVLTLRGGEPGKGSREDKVYKVHKRRVVIGAVVSADLRLVGDGVAPIHAVLEVSRDDKTVSYVATLYDVASETGVFVNGEKTITQVLKAGDEITIGRYVIKFALDDVNTVVLPRERVKEFDGRKLYLNPGEDLAPLLLQDEREVEEVFDYRGTDRSCVEVVMSWSNTILDVEHFTDFRDVTIGNDSDTDFVIPALLAEARFPLVSRKGEEFTLNLDSQMCGVMHRQGQMQKIENVRSESVRGPNGFMVPLSRDDFAKISIKDIDFYVSFSAAPPKLKKARTFERDPLFFKIFLSSMSLTIVTIVALLSLRVPPSIEAEQLPDRIATILYQPEKYAYNRKSEPVSQKLAPVPKMVEPIKAVALPKVTKVEIQPGHKAPKKDIPKVMDTGSQAKALKAKKEQLVPKAASTHKQNEAKEGQGSRAKGKEGIRGAPKAPKADEHQTKALRPAPQAGKGVGAGASQVPDIGNVDLLKNAGSKIQNLLGSSANKLGKGGEKLQGFGGFTTMGNNGLALSGSGQGGGGTAESLGGLSDKGHGGGRVGTGLGAAGNGSGIIGGRTRIVIRSGGAEEAVVLGAIDADAVEAALLAHKDEFRRCYESEINAETPKLAGRVGTSFVIGSSGRVTNAGIESTTLRHNGVERCLLKVIKRIDFPVPRGGGVVQVTYPFKFSSLGKVVGS